MANGDVKIRLAVPERRSARWWNDTTGVYKISLPLPHFGHSK